jgi:hypothetical protein
MVILAPSAEGCVGDNQETEQELHTAKVLDQSVEVPLKMTR